jgi:4-amino-4-deoxy-L-arabinose transferase-like glycosyltransferase
MVWLAALAALTLLRLALAATLPLAPDETYYLLWAHHLQAGYFDHPPMVAWWIYDGASFAGVTPLGIRLLGPISAAVGSILLWRAGEDLFPNRNAGIAAAALLNATLMVGAGAIIMTPDTPLLFFWTAGIAACSRLIATNNPRWLLAIGAMAGAMLLSKYTGLLFIGAIGLWLLSHQQGRGLLRTPWPWAGLALALLIFIPNIYWNATNNWVSYAKQGGRLASFNAPRAAQYFAELVVSQIGLATPIIFGLAILGLCRLRFRTPAGSLLICLTAAPAAVFFEHIVSGRIQANWPAVLYPSACLAAAFLAAPILRRWLNPALALGLALNALVYIQAIAAPFPIPAHSDPTALQLAGWQDLTEQVDAQAALQHAAFITSDEYATAAELSFHGNGVKVIGFDTRWHYFAMPPAAAGQTGLMVTRRTDTACRDQLGTAYRRRGSQVISIFKICRFVSPPRSVLLP